MCVISKWLENTAVKSLFCLFMSFPKAFLSIPEYYSQHCQSLAFPFFHPDIIPSHPLIAPRCYIHLRWRFYISILNWSPTLPLFCWCVSIVLNLSRGSGCFLCFKTMNSLPRTFRSNTHKLFGINILFSLFCCGYFEDRRLFYIWSFLVGRGAECIFHLVFAIFLLLFQIKVYYRGSAFADMKKNCSFSGDLSLSLKRGRLWCK